jgi:hypothetical protein
MGISKLRFPGVPLQDGPGVLQYTNLHIRRVCIFLFLACFVIFLVGSGGHLYSSDEETMYSTTEALVKSHRLSLSAEMVQNRRLGVVYGKDGKFYSLYGILPSITGIPLFVLGEGVASFYPGHFRPYILRLFVCFSNTFITAFICVLIFLFAFRLFQSRTIAYWVVASYAAGSLALQYAKTFLSEPLCTLCLVLATYFLFLIETDGNNVLRSAIAGLSLGAAVLTKTPSLIFLPILGIYLWLKSSPLRKEGVRTTVSFCVGLFPPILLYLLLQHSQYGAFFASPYDQLGSVVNFQTPLYFGLDGLLFSSGKGFIFFFPLSVLAISALLKLRNKRFAEAVLFSGIFVTDLLFYSTYSYWYGGNCWGPRFLFYSIPFVTLALGAYLQDLNGGRPGAYLFLVLFVASVGVQLGGSLIYFNQYIGSLRLPAYEYAATYQGMATINFNPKFSPIIGHWKLAIHDWKNRGKLREYLAEPRIVAMSENAGMGVAKLDSRDTPFMWTTATSLFAVVPGKPVLANSVDVALDTDVPVQPDLRFEINGNPVNPVSEWKEGRLSLYRLPLAGGVRDSVWLTIHCNTWVPAEHIPGSQDHRHIGVGLFFARAAGQVIGWTKWEGGQAPFWATPLPSAPIYLFGWFWLPVLDFWWIFAAYAGMPTGFVVLTALLMLGLACGISLVSSRLIAQPVAHESTASSLRHSPLGSARMPNAHTAQGPTEGGIAT